MLGDPAFWTRIAQGRACPGPAPLGHNFGPVRLAEHVEHYQRVVVALNEMIRLMGEIYEIIEEHGGWPIQ
jgi:hypothetical protein